ncbi:hypothetical protein AYY19_18435 [Photobacterium aquimaris]|uniref:Uncharacterized protein n=1 Tax=Photobacterium aquimaris TaxID=512643 RepID=A0A2T3IQW9_9GAMM|nr:hypothetical protein [Photobacterium aquimaris]OBU14997.1 hypothetical protein AYY19_18435 [Photobacterium aquimaris]OBU18105.1 hypothetical protein AYY20_18600 [Photobacterium aquimaris]PSU30724.1 hypothetical protein CTM88_03725 [Photobacterium aquimaris]PSW00098.1 hypothetical protein CTM91_14040 [Photobacterium aquimaris]
MRILDCEIKVLELAHPVGQKRFRGIAYEFCVDGKWLEPQPSINEVLAATQNEAKKLIEVEVKKVAEEYGYVYQYISEV